MTRSLAARTRAAVRRHPFLLEALAADVVSYADAARFLAADLDSPDEAAVATALRRFADDLEVSVTDRTVRVSMESGVGVVDGAEDPVLSVAGTGIARGAGSDTALLARGHLRAGDLRAVLGRLSAAGIDPVAAGATDETLVVVVDRTDGADALRVVEDALERASTVEEP